MGMRSSCEYEENLDKDGKMKISNQVKKCRWPFCETRLSGSKIHNETIDKEL